MDDCEYEKQTQMESRSHMTNTPTEQTEDVYNRESSLDNIPKALIFTNLPHSIFDKSPNNPVKTDFEAQLQKFDSQIKIAYLRNFSRARVEFTSSATAALVKQNFHNIKLDNKEVKAFFVRIPALYDTPEKSTLSLPKLEKQFLISPPASPPVGWEPITEHQPIINYDLIHAMLSLSTEGGEHELHSGCEQSNIPKIIVHLTPDDTPTQNGPIEHTRRPPILVNGVDQSVTPATNNTIPQTKRPPH